MNSHPDASCLADLKRIVVGPPEALAPRVRKIDAAHLQTRPAATTPSLAAVRSAQSSQAGFLCASLRRTITTIASGNGT